MLFRQLFDNTSSTYTYLLADETTRRAILIDPVFEQLSVAIPGESAAKLDRKRGENEKHPLQIDFGGLIHLGR